MRLKESFIKFKSFVKESKRVLKITKKPSSQEFQVIVKISGLGIIAIGVIGFLIHILTQMI
jgi:protein transport protein SEC61 subunit gamma and related proteins